MLQTTKMRLLLLLSIVLISSCKSTQKELIDKAVAKDPTILLQKEIPTVTIVAPRKVVDSLLLPIDTMRVVEGEGISVNVFRFPTGSPCDTVPVSIAVGASTPADTIRDTVRVDIIDYSKVAEVKKKALSEGTIRGLLLGFVIGAIFASLIITKR
jgi:hypothetical protein